MSKWEQACILILCTCCCKSQHGAISTGAGSPPLPFPPFSSKSEMGLPSWLQHHLLSPSLGAAAAAAAAAGGLSSMHAASWLACIVHFLHSFTLPRSLEQQQLGARSAILQGHAALEALGVMRERLPESLLPERRLHASTDLLAAASSAPGTAPDTKGPGGTMQGAVLVVDLASKSAMQIVEVLGGMLTKLEQKTAELQMVQMEANPHKGQLEM
eukprot:1150286-Pelagomonas_calceolata.AAC.8